MNNGIFRARVPWLVLSLALAGTGPLPASTFIETADAGLLTSTANLTTISSGSPLDVILGTLSEDDADIFAIVLTGGTLFTATTASNVTSFFDTTLFLFNSAGLGLVANDDCPFNPPQSSIEFMPTTTGTYYLALAGFGFFPRSAAGLIWPLDGGLLPPGLLGPAGPGGAQALNGWLGSSPEAGAYRITLTGAQALAVPEPGTSLLVGAGLWWAVRKQVRRTSHES